MQRPKREQLLDLIKANVLPDGLPVRNVYIFAEAARIYKGDHRAQGHQIQEAIRALCQQGAIILDHRTLTVRLLD